jgi:hypothetical protein
MQHEGRIQTRAEVLRRESDEAGRKCMLRRLSKCVLFTGILEMALQCRMLGKDEKVLQAVV